MTKYCSYSYKKHITGKLPFKNSTVPSYESEKLKSCDLGTTKQLNERCLFVYPSIHYFFALLRDHTLSFTASRPEMPSHPMHAWDDISFEMNFCSIFPHFPHFPRWLLRGHVLLPLSLFIFTCVMGRIKAFFYKGNLNLPKFSLLSLLPPS